MKTKTITRLGILLCLGLILSYVESLIPIMVAVPGFKIGLSNIVTMYVLYLYDNKKAFTIMVLKVVLSGFLFSGISAIIYGLAGGVFCIVVMSLLKKTNLFSIMTVSMTGAISHNFGQLVAAFIVMRNVQIFMYFPVLILTGTVTGLLIGFLSGIVIKRLENSSLFSSKDV
ncbi:MAG: Gx transporter family protein [Lachnospiraceae bacterium]|nr:Gx transporter family protein [Lachnospiraceae bacterium]